MSVYQAMVNSGIPIDHHGSDLYVKHCPQSVEILRSFEAPELEVIHARTFINPVDDELWIEIPFQYLPWWQERIRNA